MSTVVDVITAIVRHELGAVRTTEIGVVDDVHPHSATDDDDNYGVDLTLRNSGLALKRVPVLTGHIGSVAIPDVGDLVLVTFDHGDVNQPIVVGRLYNSIDRPPLSSTGEMVFRLPLATDDNASILAAIRNHPDATPPREMVIEMPPKITVRILDGQVTATAGSTEMKLDQTGSSGGSVTVTAGRTAITMTQDGDVLLDSAGSVTVKAARDLSLQANGNIQIKAGMAATIEAGTRALVKARIQAELQGSAAAGVQGATVSIQGQTSFTP